MKADVAAADEGSIFLIHSLATISAKVDKILEIFVKLGSAEIPDHVSAIALGVADARNEVKQFEILHEILELLDALGLCIIHRRFHFCHVGAIQFTERLRQLV